MIFVKVHSPWWQRSRRRISTVAADSGEASVRQIAARKTLNNMT
jgi:hypothetical protein